MKPIFTIPQGMILMMGYGIIAFAISWLFSRHSHRNKLQFLVANRSLGKWEAAFSISATWIWAPALFIAAQKAYTQGLAGLFWFTVPNVLCLIIFAFFAEKLRQKMPSGFTLSDYMRERFSNRVQNLYMVELVGLAACSFGVQLLAGGKIISALTRIPFFWVTVVLAVISLSYSVFSGIKASVVTDYAQMVWILLVGFTLIPWAIGKAGGMEVVIKGLGGVSGEFANIFSAKGLEVAVAFGIPVTIGLLAGPFGDQSFWQRAFATKQEHVKSAFIWGAIIFALVPLLMSLTGFTAAGKGWAVADVARTNLEAVMKLLPTWTLIPFVYMLLSGLVSTQDSNLCSIASIVGHDIVNRRKSSFSPSRKTKESEVMFLSRLSMILLVIVTIGIANLPGIRILHLFLFYGTLRASTLLPTIITLLSGRVHEGGVFWGILVSFLVGLPIFAFGNITNRTAWVVAGSLITVLSSGTITLLASKFAKGGGAP